MLTMIFSETLKENLAVLKSTPFFALVIAAEIFLSNFHYRKVYNWKETATNFFLSLLNGGLDLLVRSVYLVVLVYAWNYHLVIIESPWIYWTVLILGIDLLMYWLHRMEHFCRLFWAAHVTHHSAEHMNCTVEFRTSVFQPLYRFVFFIPLAWLGFAPIDIFFVYSLMQTWGLFVHTELVKKLGWLEYVMVTPSHHRVHHASNVKYLDKNMGFLLIIWDKLFGTFQEELPATAYEPIRYGLTKPLENKNPANIIFHEWVGIWKDMRRNDIRWNTKMKYLFKPPGWSHDGSRQTSNEMRQLHISSPHEIHAVDDICGSNQRQDHPVRQQAH
ncbi:MAG TPA: sterol desaturase family protein [Chitinophagaceae bacterium]|nr:sterol desaturase family protein [Chitinophagaceae bacterium]